MSERLPSLILIPPLGVILEVYKKSKKNTDHKPLWFDWCSLVQDLNGTDVEIPMVLTKDISVNKQCHMIRYATILVRQTENILM